MKCVAVIGGAGFIGTRLCQNLRSAAINFRIVDKRVSESMPEVSTVADVTSPDDLRKALVGCDSVINLAAMHRDDVRPRSLYDLVNVEGARNICLVAEELGINRIVFTSTVAVYGFAAPNADEGAALAPFNDYGRTKAQAEAVFVGWQKADPGRRSLVIVRPTVVFGERNRGNVYNLLRQVASGLFVMIGSGRNRKSMAYVGNVAAFLQFMLDAAPGVHVCNYVDKPDFDMNELVRIARETLGKSDKWVPRIPYVLGYSVAGAIDAVAFVARRNFPISRIRVRKFCATTQFASAASDLGFRAPYALRDGLELTLRSEFLSGDGDGPLHYSE